MVKPSKNPKTLNHLRAALSSRDPYEIASVFELPCRDQGKSGTEPTVRGISLQIDGIDWTDVLTSLNGRNISIENGDTSSIFMHQSKLHSSFNHIFSSTPGNVFVPALHAVAKGTYHCATLEDNSTSSKPFKGGNGGGTKDNSRIQSAVTLLQESFSKTLNDRKEMVQINNSTGMIPLSEDGSKKVGVLCIVNLLFSMYFRLNTLRLCKNLLRPVESRNIHEKGTMSEMVTYRYYVGRLSMFEDQYETAEKHLDYAMRHCHMNAKKNKKRILNYLLPVKLLRGRLPTDKLLQKYSLHEFTSIVRGIRTGDLRTFNDGLNKYQDLFIRRGTYLLLEKCKTVCYRNLFKRIYTIQQKVQIPLSNFVMSFKWLGLSIDLDEVECILANLIFRGFMKGYISHSKRILVLSKRDPFPVSAVCKK